MAAPSFDAELHIETTTIMFADVVESVRLIEEDDVENIYCIESRLMKVADDVPSRDERYLFLTEVLNS